MTRLILASASPHRRALLENAGVAVEAFASRIDERAVEGPLVESGVGPEDIADILAEAKASEVSERFADALVIGADQTLGLEGDLLHKAGTMEAARRQLLLLSGRTHRLTSAVVLASGGRTLWRHSGTADITFRSLTPPEIGRYLAKAGEGALSSVGCYQVEGLGVRLIERIEGDLFTVIGLPLLPLLSELRRRRAIDD